MKGFSDTNVSHDDASQKPNKCLKRKRVRFVETVDIYDVTTVPKDDDDFVWYNGRDYFEFQERDKRLIQMVESFGTGSRIERKFGDCCRGLENHLPNKFERVALLKRDVYKAVFSIQMEQGLSHISDPEEIASIYHRKAEPATLAASVIGLKDQKYVQECVILKNDSPRRNQSSPKSYLNKSRFLDRSPRSAERDYRQSRRNRIKQLVSDKIDSSFSLDRPRSLSPKPATRNLPLSTTDNRPRSLSPVPPTQRKKDGNAPVVSSHVRSISPKPKIRTSSPKVPSKDFSREERRNRVRQLLNDQLEVLDDSDKTIGGVEARAMDPKTTTSISNRDQNKKKDLKFGARKHNALRSVKSRRRMVKELLNDVHAQGLHKISQ